MEFDKSKVFTIFNCDELKVGSKGYVADNKDELITRVQYKDDEYYLTIKGIEDINDYPFRIDSAAYRYFYLVEEPKEETKRPCTREELVEMLKKQGLPMLKHLSNVFRTVLSIHQEDVFDDVGGMSYLELCNQYTLLDGTELWVEE